MSAKNTKLVTVLFLIDQKKIGILKLKLHIFFLKWVNLAHICLGETVLWHKWQEEITEIFECTDIYKRLSVVASGYIGTLLPRIAAFPRCSRIPSRPHRWRWALLSSCPVWHERAAPYFLTSLSAAGCHPPSDSATIGRKAIPSAPLSFLLWAKVKACPGVVAAPATVAAWSGLTTVTSRAASLPAAQWGTSTSAGRRSAPGMRNLPSLVGPSPPATASF